MKMLKQALHRAAAVAAPPPQITTSQWADERLYLSPEDSAEQGKYTSARAPYQRGIMDAFTGLGNLESASLAVVAPGIAEALVATAIGLFAAIPAVIGYNRFAYSLDRLSSQYESFMQEFQNILGRQA